MAIDKNKLISLGEVIINSTYSELSAMKNRGDLIPGQLYRITDYQCTTTQSNTTSADHQFDIIVFADDESTLNENARAILHSGDTYFANSNLAAWELKYCLDNDSNRFAWADSNGKGIIYYMKDEWNNECPYDFKNIQFYRTWNPNKELWCESFISSDNVAAYTFSSSGSSSTTSFTDYSLSANNNVYSNVIKEEYYSNKITLNNICFFGNNCYSNTFGNNCYSNTFGNSCYCNTFGNDCYSNTFKKSCYSNTFGNECNINTFGATYYYNTFGNFCDSNTFGNNCYNNTFGNNCRYNTFGNSCYCNTFGNECKSNTFGNSCCYNTFGVYCDTNTFGNNCLTNTFGDCCLCIKFSSNSTGNAAGNYFLYNTIENGVRYVILYNTATASSSQPVKNYHIKSSVVGTGRDYKTIEATRNNINDIEVALNSSGVVKIYCEADLIN